MLNDLILRFSRDLIAEIGHKDSTIFFNRCNFIKKLTVWGLKKSVSSRKKSKKDGKRIGFYPFYMANCRFFCQKCGKFINYSL